MDDFFPTVPTATVNIVNKDLRFQRLLDISETEIHLDPASLRNGFLHNEKELFYDFFACKYQGQNIIIAAGDGENLKECGLFDIFERLCQHNLIPREKILFKTYDTHFSENFQHSVLPPGLLWTLDDPPADSPPAEVPTDAKFVGITVGRFTPSRFRMAYELDQSFKDDAFVIFNPKKDLSKNFMTRMGKDYYQKEVQWLETRKFDIDEITSYNDVQHTAHIVPETVKGYSTLWPKFKIEIVPETDVFSNHWFTEKIGRCIITGKPFLLLAGQHSLQRVKELGFVTFSKVIDESYDDEHVPGRRIAKIIESLQELYSSPDRDQRIQQLYSIAHLNKRLYPKLKKVYDRQQI